MKRRFFLSLLALFFGFGIVCISAINVGASQNDASPSSELSTATNSAALDKTSAPSPEIIPGQDYYLAYPGILPDQPLYMLKMLRDKVKLWLTRDPQEKTQLLLLYADKRIGAALALAQGGKAELAATTAQKAEKYLQQVVEKVQILPDTGLLPTIGQAALKHQQVMLQIHQILPDEYKADVATALNTNNLIVADLINLEAISDTSDPNTPESTISPDQDTQFESNLE